MIPINLLFVGDVVSSYGVDFLLNTLPQIKRAYKTDFCIVNGENSAVGNGITPNSYHDLLSAGADLITGGNHTFRRPEFADILDDEFSAAIRPANVHSSAPGRGYAVLTRGSKKLGVINLMGESFMDMKVTDPFDKLDELIKLLNAQNIKNILVDFHAEATGEKRAMGFYTDGRVSALLGTHTHVRTADAQILPNGTAYQTDVGMTGVINSVLGVNPDDIIKRLHTGLPVRFTNNPGPCSMGCTIIKTDDNTGKTVAIESYEMQ